LTVPSELLAWARDCVASAGCLAESEAYLEQVAAWRDCWRPSAMRVFLVAESHVSEQTGDASVRVPAPVPTGRPVPPGSAVSCTASDTARAKSANLGRSQTEGPGSTGISSASLRVNPGVPSRRSRRAACRTASVRKSPRAPARSLKKSSKVSRGTRELSGGEFGLTTPEESPGRGHESFVRFIA